MSKPRLKKSRRKSKCSPEIAARIAYLIFNCPGAEDRFIRLLAGTNIVYDKEKWNEIRDALGISNTVPHNPHVATLIQEV